MTLPLQLPKPKKHPIIRRLGAAVVVAVLVFVLLWYTVFNATTAALLAAGGCGMLFLAGSASDVVEAALETLALAVLAVFAAIGVFVGAFFSFFY